jgi:membrane-bound lytic murein transglycosylase C
MPSRKVWVQYDDSMKTRTIMDFERGELRIEHLMTSGESTTQAHQLIESALLQARDETIADLDKFDLEMRLARQIAWQRGMVITEVSPSTQDASMRVLEGLIDDEAMMDLNAQHMEMLPLTSDDKRIRTAHKMSYRIRFKPGSQTVLARRYLEPVLEQSQIEDISPSLIYAIIQTESAFNPRAVSPVPAYGLMQLVPTSGGLDAYQYIFGTKRVVGPEFLFHAGNNIRLGTAYLKILDSRYLKAISNPLSRLYCVIAAYNTGAGNVARAFTGKTNTRSAARVINELTPEQVLEQLQARLPFVETQRYIVKVLSARKNYSVWDDSTLSQVR